MPKIDFSRAIPAREAWREELGQLRERLGTLLLARIETRMQDITGPVPLAEKLSWPLKEAAARAWLQGGEAGDPDPILRQEADLMGETVSGLARSILARADSWRQAISGVTGIRRRALAEIALADTPAAATAALAEAEAALQRL